VITIVEIGMKALHRDVRVNEENLIVFDVTVQTGDENLREIGAISALLIELVQEVCGLSGRISVEKFIDGIRVSIITENSEDSTYALKGGD
jgi:hypothetical protein